MGELLIPYGRRPDGRMVSPSAADLARGLACECCCPVCDARLVARRGERNQPHFAHETETGCRGAGESSIHLMAKQIISENFAMLLPPAVVDGFERTRQLLPLETDRWHRLTNVRYEEWLGGFRPDIVATFAGCVFDGLSRSLATIGEDVLIEIAVTHFCDAAKVDKIRERGVACFQIDLSRVKRLASEDDLRDAINLTPRSWLFHPFFKQAKLDLMREETAQWAVKRARLERELNDLRRDREANEVRALREAEARQIKMLADVEANKARLAERRAQALSFTPSVVFERASELAPPVVVERRIESRKPYYDYNDLAQRAAMEEWLRQPVKRTR